MILNFRLENERTMSLASDVSNLGELVSRQNVKFVTFSPVHHRSEIFSIHFTFLFIEQLSLLPLIVSIHMIYISTDRRNYIYEDIM